MESLWRKEAFDFRQSYMDVSPSLNVTANGFDVTSGGLAIQTPVTTRASTRKSIYCEATW